MLHVILGVCHFLSQTGRIIFELKKKKEKKKENPSVKYSLKRQDIYLWERSAYKSAWQRHLPALSVGLELESLSSPAFEFSKVMAAK